MHGMAAEDYAANSILEKNDLSWEEWGGRVNEYLQLIEVLFWPNIFIIGGGISKSFNEFKAFLDLDTEVVPAESRNHAGIIGAALAASAKQRK